jgi:hypothetical protein
MAGERACSECGAQRPELLTCAGCGEAAYCAAACQRKAWKGHRAACRPFRVEAVAGKGLGMVATRPLRAGARVLLEAPVLVRSLGRAEAAAGPGLAEQLAALPVEVQRRVLALHTEDPAASQEDRLRGVFEANAIEVSSAGCTALYPTIPRCPVVAMLTNLSQDQPLLRPQRGLELGPGPPARQGGARGAGHPRRRRGHR